MKLKSYKIVLLTCMIAIINFNFNNAICEVKAERDIKEGAVTKFKNTDLFIINFSNLIYEKKGKELKIPIFRGNMGDAYYKSFHEYCYKNNLLERGWGESGFIIEAEKGMLTKTFHEFLNFYKGNILKNADITKPNKIKVYGGDLALYYDFIINGVPFALQVEISTDKKEINDVDSIKSIFDVNLNENMTTPNFTFRFWKNKTSNGL